MQLDYWAEEKVIKMENESLAADFARTQDEISQAPGSKFFKRHLLNSVNESLALKDIESVNSMHRYFDYNLNFIDMHSGKPTHPVKVHHPELSMAGLQLKLG